MKVKRSWYEGHEIRAMRDLHWMSKAQLLAMSKKGTAPVHPTLGRIVLHHLGQQQDILIEIPAKFHKISNRKQHPVGCAKGKGVNGNGRAEFDRWRPRYWKWRANEEMKRRTL